MGEWMWLQAERDLDSARIMLQPRGYYVAANLAHQAAEKALKAAHWYLKREEPSWTHDVAALAEQVTASVELIPGEVRLACRQLHPLYGMARYPSSIVEEPIPADIVGLDDAQTALQSAEEVIAWVRTLLQRPKDARQPRKNY